MLFGPLLILAVLLDVEPLNLLVLKCVLCIHVWFGKKLNNFQSFFVNPTSHKFDIAQNQVSTILKKT